ncbi:NAD(P)H-binding protein [Agromyces sp. NPDC058064]|uniref:NAD(P)H-binding protein n=1 Tax=Agromyces sp. NPDC058064 TaxID=3346322 RepID=UPI0036D90754
MARIVLIGGHGKVALRLSRLLAARGDEVDAVIRNPDHAAEVAATGANPVVADIETLDADGFAELVRGHDAVVWSAGAGGGDPRRTYAVDRDAALRSMAAAEAAGVRRYVMVSYFRSPDHSVPEADPFHAYAEAKAAADEHLVTTALDWTILGPSRLTDGEGTGRIDAGASESLTVDRADVAAVAAAVLEEPSTVGRTIRFNEGSTPIADAIR